MGGEPDARGRPMLRVGLTGGIAAGKSEVARLLAEQGAVVIDADAVAREVVAPGTPGLAEVTGIFGPGVLRPDGSLDRPALGEIVFADPELRARLNAVVHPRVGRLIRHRGMTREQAMARIAAQASRKQRLAIAGIVIDNSGSLSELDRQVGEL